MLEDIPFRGELRDLFERGLQSPMAASALAQSLYPNGERLHSVFLPEHRDVCAQLGQIYTRMKPADPLDMKAWLKVLALDPRRTDVSVFGARGDEIAVGDPLTYAREFPDSARAIARKYLQPDCFFFEVVCKEPTASSGTRFHMLFRDQKGWCMAGPMWRMLPNQPVQ